MDIRLKFLAAEIAILTAAASLFSTSTSEWAKIYERRLYVEMELNLWRSRSEQKTEKEKTEEISASGPRWLDGYGPAEVIDEQGMETVISDSRDLKMETETESYESEEINEQKTVEEVQTGLDSVSTGAEAVAEAQMVRIGEVVDESQAEDEIPGESTAGTAADVPREQSVASPENQTTNPGTQQVDVRPDPVSMGTPGTPLYQIDGDTLDPGVADYLYRRLCEAGIGWFYEFSVCLAYQESSFNPLAENVNGRDKGLFQFRVEFHPGLDWRNPYQQVDLFVQMMTNRSAAGCDPYMMVSRHNTSDYCPEFNEVYVAQVLQYLPKMVRLR